MIRLSQRLRMIAQEVPVGSCLADIGSDHALLLVYLAKQGIIVRGIAGEINAGPYEAAVKQVGGSGLGNMIDVRHGDGLAVISPGEADVIAIAGMGGVLIASILEAGKAKLEGVKRLVLQPNVGEVVIRKWLLDHGWHLASEKILEEDRKTYEILNAIPAVRSEENDALYQPMILPDGIVADRKFLLRMGPYLLREASPVWQRKWKQEWEKLRHICDNLTQSRTEESRRKEAECRLEMKQLEEVLAACTLKAKSSFN